MLLLSSVLWSAEKITMQLPWLHQFQFAGYYVAKEKGYYADAGLDVSILDAKSAQHSFQAVMSGKAQYGVGRSSLIVNYASGAPVVLMAAIFPIFPNGTAYPQRRQYPNRQRIEAQAGDADAGHDRGGGDAGDAPQCRSASGRSEFTDPFV